MARCKSGDLLFILPEGLTAWWLGTGREGMAGFDAEGKWGTGEKTATSRGFIPKGNISALSILPQHQGYLLTPCFLQILFLVSFLPSFSLGVAPDDSAKNPFWVHPHCQLQVHPGHGEKVS